MGTNANVLAFIKLTCSEICKVKTPQSDQDNLSRTKREALKSLTSNVSITIKPSDKGRNIAAMDNTLYVDMCNKILNNKDWYQKTPDKKMIKFHQDFYDLVDKALASKILSKN